MGMTLHPLLPMVGPDFGAVGGSSQLRAIVGALLTYGLIVAVLMVIVVVLGWFLGVSPKLAEAVLSLPFAERVLRAPMRRLFENTGFRGAN